MKKTFILKELNSVLNATAKALQNIIPPKKNYRAGLEIFTLFAFFPIKHHIDRRGEWISKTKISLIPVTKSKTVLFRSNVCNNWL